uniref:Uncharacterized protein n=1 Tax=Oryza meridionalis TaxID=40149 RepID=A0A0E0DB45_9ORYZ
MECTWQELLGGLEEEPERSLAVVDPNPGAVHPEAGVDPVLYVSPEGVGTADAWRSQLSAIPSSRLQLLAIRPIPAGRLQLPAITATKPKP